MPRNPVEHYPNIERFYLRYPEARCSPESDYGVWWKGPDGDNWRVSYVHDTGHVYAIRLGGTSSGTLALGLQEELVFVSASDDSEEGPVVVLGKLPTFTRERERQLVAERREAWKASGYKRDLSPGMYAEPPEIEAALEGWAEECGKQGSLTWAYRRVQAAQEEVRC